jgi:hypothetical protein
MQVLIENGEPKWDELAKAYRDADSEDERDLIFMTIQECIAADKDLPDNADFKAMAQDFLRQRGLAD